MKSVFTLNQVFENSIRERKERLGRDVTWETVILTGIEALESKCISKKRSGISAKQKNMSSKSAI
jgi:hypothetical protein